MNLLTKRNPLVSVTLLTISALFAFLVLTGCKSAPKEAPGTERAPQVATAPTAPVAPAAPTGNPGFDPAVKATLPLAYYRLQTTKGASEVGTTTYEAVGGVTSSTPGAATGLADNHFALLNGKDGWITTTQMGGIDKAGSIMAWVNLAALPSKESHILYVAGESYSGNDFDLQFEGDNQLKFYTSAGGQVSFAPDPNTLVNRWHMIIVTMDTVAPNKAIYWDGQPAASDQLPNKPQKTTQFTIGESPVFSGRFFDGGIAEVALWGRALNAAEVAAMYKAATTKP